MDIFLLDYTSRNEKFTEIFKTVIVQHYSEEKNLKKTHIFDLKTTIHWGHRFSGVELIGRVNEILYVMAF